MRHLAFHESNRGSLPDLDIDGEEPRVRLCFIGGRGHLMECMDTIRCRCNKNFVPWKDGYFGL